MARVMAVVALLWVASGCMAAQVEVVLPLEHAEALDMSSWVASVAGAIEGGAAGLGATRLVPRPAENSLWVAGQVESVEWVKTIVAVLDKPRRQVAFEIVFVRTRHADELLGVPVTTTLDVGGAAVEVPNRLILPGAGRASASGSRGSLGASPLADSQPRPPEVAICNPDFDPHVLDTLLADGKARKAAEPRVTVLDNAMGFVGVETATSAQYEISEFGYPVDRSQSHSLSVRPAIRPDGRILVQACFTAGVRNRQGDASMRAAWAAEPGVPVALGPVPTAPDVEAVVYIVTCRVAES